MASKPYPDLRRLTWRMKYRPDPGGPWVTVTLGKDPRLKQADPPKKPPADLAARASEFTDIEYRAANGLTAPVARPRPLAELAKTYKESYPGSHDDGSVLLMRRYVDDFVGWCAGRKIATVQAVTDAHCKDFINARRKQMAPNTLKTVRGYISGLFSHAIDEKIIQVNPWGRAKVGKGIKHKKKPRFWTSDEVNRIVAACRQQWHKDLVLVLVNTGIRISATLAMRWGWIDWEEGIINVPAPWNKGGFGYSVTISDVAREILQRRHVASKRDYVFFNERREKPYTYAGGADPIERAIKKAKVSRGTPHDLRHTFARSLHLAGVPQSVISAMLGHASISTTEIYVKMEREDAVKVMRRLKIGLDQGEGA